MCTGRESCLLLVSYGNRGINKKSYVICSWICGAAFWWSSRLGCPSRSCWLCLCRSIHVAKHPPLLLPPAALGVGKEGWVLESSPPWSQTAVWWTEGSCVSSCVNGALKNYKNLCLGGLCRAGSFHHQLWCSPILPALALRRGGDWNSALPISGFGHVCGQEDWIVSGSVLNVVPVCSF